MSPEILMVGATLLALAAGFALFAWWERRQRS